jgi:polyhydroxyalkanoate synthesis regulator phasin
MNNEQKAQRYDWLLNQAQQIERQISRVPKLPLEETLQDLDSKEYSPENQTRVQSLQQQLERINDEVKVLMRAL